MIEPAGQEFFCLAAFPTREAIIFRWSFNITKNNSYLYINFLIFYPLYLLLEADERVTRVGSLAGVLAPLAVPFLEPFSGAPIPKAACTIFQPQKNWRKVRKTLLMRKKPMTKLECPVPSCKRRRESFQKGQDCVCVWEWWWWWGLANGR